MTQILERQIINALLYYDIFNYPLTEEEIVRFIGKQIGSASHIKSALTSLEAHNDVYYFNGFYGLQPDITNTLRRIRGNKLADECLKVAHKKAELIYQFPFVRAVMASGSLSKGYMDEKSDLDFFIVTASGRLWIARTLLVLYKRLFLFNSHRFFCVNYFLDEQHPLIEEQNLFTATELATVMPLQSAPHYKRLMEGNPWINTFFPNFTPRVTNLPPARSGLIKQGFERLINIFFANRLERYCRKLTLGRWKRLYQRDYDPTDFQVAFKSKEYVSKNHPRNYQKKIMELYDEKVNSFRFKQRQPSDDSREIKAQV